MRSARGTGVVARTVLKKARASSAVAERSAAKKQAQSTRHMLTYERGRSA